MANLIKKFIELIIGPIDDKRAYMQFKKRVNALPNDYRYAFKKIQKYMDCRLSLDCNIKNYMDLTAQDVKSDSIYAGLLELFETSADNGKNVIEVIGNDAAAFSDEYMRVYVSKKVKEKLNAQIKERFNEEDSRDKTN